MPVRATKNGITRFFDCSQWDLMPPGNNGWTLLHRDCNGETPNSRRPYAEADKAPPNTNYSAGGGQLQIEGLAPIVVEFEVGQSGDIYQVSVEQSNLTAGSNKVTVSGGTGKLLGSAGASVDVVEANLSLQNIGGLLNLTQIAQGGASNNQVLTWNGSAWVPQTPSSGGLTDAENGLYVSANKARLGGTLIENTSLNLSGFYLRTYGSDVRVYYSSATNYTSYAKLSVQGLASNPGTLSTPSEDAVINLHGWSATPPDVQLSFGVFTTASNGVWMQSRGRTIYNTYQPVKFQPRGGRSVFGSINNFDSYLTAHGVGLSAGSALNSYTLFVTNSEERAPKIGLGSGSFIRAGFWHDGPSVITRMFNQDGGSGAQIRWAIGGESSDKMVLKQDGSLGVNFDSITNLHSRLTVKGSIAGQGTQISSPFTYNLNADACFVAYTGSGNVTWNIDDPLTCAGRMHIIANHSASSTITLNRNWRNANGAQDNTIAAGETLICFAAGSIWRGNILT